VGWRGERHEEKGDLAAAAGIKEVGSQGNTNSSIFFSKKPRDFRMFAEGGVLHKRWKGGNAKGVMALPEPALRATNRGPQLSERQHGRNATLRTDLDC